MDMNEFTDTVVIRGEDCLYNPKAGIAILQCENCGHLNHVEVELVDGEPRFMGFSCENCGHWNGVE